MKQENPIRKGIVYKALFVFLCTALLGIVILVQVVNLKVVDKAKWIAKADSLTTGYKNIEAIRGNIYANDGSLLATSIPQFEVRMDTKADAITKSVFLDKVDSLALKLSILFKDKSKSEYKQMLVKARAQKNRYLLLKRNVTYAELKKLRDFPIFNLGRYKGGLIYLQRSFREKPFKILASRTIGFSVAGQSQVGLEGSFDEYLKGVGGQRLMQKLAGNVWRPIASENEVEPKDGSDIITTLDVNLQDVAEHSLLTQLEYHKADHGCVALMEVSTGEIKAIANLRRTAGGVYKEDYNYFIGEANEPGSTFKLASLMAAMEVGDLKLSDSVAIGDGTYRFYDREMKDAHAPEKSRYTVLEAFKHSSNVGVAKFINRVFFKNQKSFINQLKAMHVADVLGIQLNGEAKPYLKKVNSTDWYGTSLPWMSIGYEIRLTPMHILAFYNAVANNGRMVKPLFVKEIRDRGNVIKRFETEVIDDHIASEATINKARKLLEEVVISGTGGFLKNPNYLVAGKTGTAQLAQGTKGYKDSTVQYQASFAGYFPADKPKYSCIVVVNSPNNNVYYAAQVAGPIFKEIADKVFATSVEMHKSIQTMPSKANEYAPLLAYTEPSEAKNIYTAIGSTVKETELNGAWARSGKSNKGIVIKSKNISEKIPDLKGMGVKDALYLLENKGMKVQVIGRGVVTSQSIPEGAAYIKGQKITLQLGKIENTEGYTL